jgi:hypothetical protein
MEGGSEEGEERRCPGQVVFDRHFEDVDQLHAASCTK